MKEMSLELTHRNHFKFGHGESPFVFRTSPLQKWSVSYGHCQRAPGSFRDECIETAKLIREKSTQDIFILFSGGIDSEVVIRSFAEAKIPVTAAIMRFQNDLNLHDISWAVKACEALNVPYRFFDLDILKFWEESAQEYADLTYCFSPQLIASMWLMDQVPGFPVLGSGECLLVKDFTKSEWQLWEKERIAAWYRYLLARNKEGCAGFFQYTPEIMLSFLNDPFVRRLLDNKIEDATTTQDFKLPIYQQHFSLAPRPKYTGFEKIQVEDWKLRTKLKEKYSFADEIVKTSCEELRKMLSPL